jgi:hypothetical protein
MIYDSLDTIPYKLFIKIAETGDFTLLSDVENNQITTVLEQLAKVDILSEIWNKLYDEHLNKNQTSESKKIFKLSKTIDELIATNKVVLISCGCLRFDFNQELYDIIVGYGYQLSVADTKTYYSDIDRIEREANAYIIKAEYYQKMLPEPKENENSEYDIDDIMAGYSIITGLDFDYNLISYTKFHAFQKQAIAKVKAMEKQNNKS